MICEREKPILNIHNSNNRGTSSYDTRGAQCPSGLESSTGDRVVLGSNLLLPLCFGSLEIPFTTLCQYLSDETLKSVGPFYLVSMPGEVKYPT